MPRDPYALTALMPSLNWVKGEPRSQQFDDIYFAPESGVAESRFVFLDGCNVETCFQQHVHSVIGELGFGTGLNFLLTAEVFLQVAPAHHRLTFVSVEKYPLRPATMAQALNTLNLSSELRAEFLATYPPPAPGFHIRRLSGGRVNLILMFGDAADMLKDLRLKAHAWYLDGFAPARNPDLWSETLFKNIARCSHKGAIAATFSAAGVVKRCLNAAGFKVEKHPGFGRKRERIIARYEPSALPQTVPRWWHPPAPKTGPVAIIGGGIAGRMLAQALKHHGQDIQLFSSIAPQSQLPASQVPAIVLAPRFQLDPSVPTAPFMTSAFAQAVSMPAYRRAQHRPSGLRLMPRTDADAARLQRLADACQWGKDWLHLRDDGGIDLPKSGSYDSATLLDSFWPYIDMTLQDITALQQVDGHDWILIDDRGHQHGPYGHVVVCQGAAQSLLTDDSALRTHRRHGQTCYGRADMGDSAVAAGGYVSAVLDRETGRRLIGATSQDFLHAGFDSDQLIDRFPDAYKTSLVLEEGDAGVFTAQRCHTSDHMPLVGPLLDMNRVAEVYSALSFDRHRHPDTAAPYRPGLWMLGALGAKGFQYAPYLAEILAAQIADAPLPVASTFLSYIHPARFVIRDLIRSQ